MNALFTVTSERWTYDDIEAGDTTECGTVSEGDTLRDALRLVFHAPMASTEHITASCSDRRAARWVEWSGLESFRTGDRITYAIHFPKNTTGASRARLCRLLGA